MKKLFVRAVVLNLWISSWLPFIYIIINLSKLDKSRLEWYVSFLLYLGGILIWAIAIGSSIFLYKIKGHDWSKYLE